MKVELNLRSYGVHERIKECEINGDFNDYCTLISGSDYIIEEQKLIDNLPDGFFPVDPNKILLTITEGNWGTGQIDLNIFKRWAKYFDCYVISLVKEVLL